MVSHGRGCVCSSCLTFKRSQAWYRFQAPAAGVPMPGRASDTAGYPTAEVGGVSPPLGNTGETYTPPTAETLELVVDGGRVKEVTRRVPSQGHCAVVDTLRFTIHQNTFLKTHIQDNGLSVSTLLSDDDFILEASRLFASIFGFGVTRSTGKGRDFYRDAHVLGENFGFVCIGNAGKNNQQGTMLVELSGSGCLNALPGWEARLYDFLSTVALRPVITRIDICHDDIEGTYLSPDWAESQWLSGGFTKCTGKHPNIERAGNWHLPTGAGRTLYIGSRKHSSIFARFYEKGMEQGDPSSPWCRAEVEFKNSDRVLPLDMLLRPSDFFLAAYPALAFIDAHRTPERIAVKQKKAHIGVSHAKETIKHQFGKYLRVLLDLADGDANTLLSELVCDDPTAWPARLQVLAAGATTFEGLYVHDLTRLIYDADFCSVRSFCPFPRTQNEIVMWDSNSGRYIPAVSDSPATAGYSR